MLLLFRKAKQTQRRAKKFPNDPKYKREILEWLQNARGFATPMMELIPALLFAQLGDVRGVVTAVPPVKEEQPIHILQAGFRMAKRTRVLLRRDGSQQTNPAVVEGIQKFERNFDRCVLGIIEPGPIGLLVRLDRRFSFGQREPQPDVGVHVAVGHVVDYLAHSPAAFAVGSFKLQICQSRDG